MGANFGPDFKRCADGVYRGGAWEVVPNDGHWDLLWRGCHLKAYRKAVQAKAAAGVWADKVRRVGVPMGPMYQQRLENAVRAAVGLEPRHRMELWH